MVSEDLGATGGDAIVDEIMSVQVDAIAGVASGASVEVDAVANVGVASDADASAGGSGVRLRRTSREAKLARIEELVAQGYTTTAELREAGVTAHMLKQYRTLRGLGDGDLALPRYSVDTDGNILHVETANKLSPSVSILVIFDKFLLDSTYTPINASGI
jgi:hypothetical protein